MKFLLLCLSLNIAVAIAQTCTTWTEQEYDTSADNYNDGVGTPRGFLKAQIPNPETASESDNPCIIVTADDTIQYMEVLIETLSYTGTSNQASNICIDIADDGITCNKGRTSYCGRIPSLTTTITFKCVSGSGCDHSVFIYYRVNLSRSDIDNEDWCSSRTQDYPSGLITTHDRITPQFTGSVPAARQ